MSTINYTYNVIVDRFRQFADGHFQLRRFTHGEISQADLEKEAEWPWMHVKPRAINYSPGTRAFSFEIFISDLPRDKEDKTGYQAESITDCSLIFQDLINEIHLGNMFGSDVLLTRPVNSEPFVEQYTHTLTGVTGIIELSLDYDWSACSIPASWNYNTPTNSPNDGFGALQFIESLHQDGVFVSLDNDVEAPGNSYYYGTNASGVKGWYAIVDNIGLTCETLPDCAVIISIVDDIATLQGEMLLKANSADLGATAFSNSYNDLDNLPTLPTGTVTSVGLTMPSAFSVANSPITSSGDIAVTGAGTVSQYVRGDGSLANFPTSTGGGSSLTFYLNGSVAQGTFGGVAFKEMDRVPVLGVGTDFTIATNGYIQSFITDANVPNLLEIPAGNWNFETYFSASSNGGNPSFYIELYKWNGATLSLIASNSATPEGITNGTATHLYLSAIAVPQTTLALTDRLAVRIYVNNSGRTIKLHTENSHLCEVITTFSTGLTALNGLTAQVQNFATGTSGTDFGISSATSTHTFNLPTASAANRGALSSADWTTFNGKQDLLVSATNIKTINGNSVLGSGDLVVGGTTTLAIGTTPITSGTIGRILFEGTGNVLQESANLFWDNTNGRLGIGTATPTTPLEVIGRVTLGKDATVTTQSVSIIQAKDTNTGVVIKPNGTGSILANIPDGTLTGGNARGSNSVDLQMSRALNTQVAAAPFGFIGGGSSNQIRNDVDSIYNVICGGRANTITFGRYNTISGGELNTAGNQEFRSYSSVVGGRSNFASGTGSVTGGEQNNLAESANNSTAFGRATTITGQFSGGMGFANVMSGEGSFALAIGSTSNAVNTILLGRSARAYLPSQLVHGANNGNIEPYEGTYQCSEIIPISTATLTSGQTSAISSGSLIIPFGTNRIWNVEINTTAVVTAITGTATGVAVGNVYIETKKLCFKKVGGVSSVVGVVDTVFVKSDGGMTTASVTAAAGASQSLALTFVAPTFVGGGSVSVRVLSKVNFVEIAY